MTELPFYGHRDTRNNLLIEMSIILHINHFNCIFIMKGIVEFEKKLKHYLTTWFQNWYSSVSKISLVATPVPLVPQYSAIMPYPSNAQPRVV